MIYGSMQAFTPQVVHVDRRPSTSIKSGGLFFDASALVELQNKRQTGVQTHCWFIILTPPVCFDLLHTFCSLWFTSLLIIYTSIFDLVMSELHFANHDVRCNNTTSDQTWGYTSRDVHTSSPRGNIPLDIILEVGKTAHLWLTTRVWLQKEVDLHWLPF